MRAKFCKTIVLAAIAGVMGVSAAHSELRPDHDGDERGLQGTWMVRISLRDCTSGAYIGAPFLSLLTFARGGTVTETTSNPMFFPAVRGPGHGVWSRTGRDTYRAATAAFITVNGVLARTQTITQAIRMEGDDKFKTKSAGVKFFNPDGSLLATACAAAAATRFELEPEK